MLLPIIGILVAIVVPFSIAYMQRKLTVHVEAHKLNPELPPKPVPLPIWEWVVDHWWWFSALMSFGLLISFLVSTDQFSPKLTAVIVSFDISNIVYSLLMYQIQRLRERIDKEAIDRVTIDHLLTENTTLLGSILRARTSSASIPAGDNSKL